MMIIIPRSGEVVKGFFDFFCRRGPLGRVDDALRAVNLDKPHKRVQEAHTVKLVKGANGLDDLSSFLNIVHGVHYIRVRGECQGESGEFLRSPRGGSCGAQGACSSEGGRPTCCSTGT